jgi:hypothetical protein
MLFLFVLHWSSSGLHNIYYMWSGLSPFLFELPGSTPALNTTCRLSTMVAQSTAPLKPHTHRTAGRGLALFRNLGIEGSLSSIIRVHDKLCPKPPMGDKKIKPSATLTRYTPLHPRSHNKNVLILHIWQFRERLFKPLKWSHSYFKEYPRHPNLKPPPKTSPTLETLSCFEDEGLVLTLKVRCCPFQKHFVVTS